MLLSASLTIMEEALKNPDRLTKSSYLIDNDPNTFKTELTKAMESVRSRAPKGLVAIFIIYIETQEVAFTVKLS